MLFYELYNGHTIYSFMTISLFQLKDVADQRQGASARTARTVLYN